MKEIDLNAIKTLDPKAVFSVSEVARLLGITHMGVLKKIGRGNLKAGKNGSRYFIPGSEIQKQIALPEDPIAGL